MSEPGSEGDSPQLRFWGSASRRQALGSLPSREGEWEVHLVVENVAPDLFHGRIAFVRGDERRVTAAVIVEETEGEVLERAEEMPESMLRQFLVSVGG